VPPSITKFLDWAEGEVLYISKPKLLSCGLALPLKFISNRPVILNVDDWEAGLRSKRSFVQTYLGSLHRLVRPGSIYQIRATKALSGLSDMVTVSNTFFHDRLGREAILHVRDTEAFGPDRFDGRAAQVKHGILTDSTVVMSSGTPHPHKGVEELLKAVSAYLEDVAGVTYRDIQCTGGGFRLRRHRLRPRRVARRTSRYVEPRLWDLS
jgi:hypothetical protein